MNVDENRNKQGPIDLAGKKKRKKQRGERGNVRYIFMRSKLTEPDSRYRACRENEPNESETGQKILEHTRVFSARRGAHNSANYRQFREFRVA